MVVVPTYNEAASIEELLRRLTAAAPDVDVLVVDDRSPDGTAALARDLGLPRVHVLDHEERAGLGGAYRAGFGWALAAGYDVVCQMDGDLSHAPESLPALIEATRLADVAIGSRYVPGGSVGDWSARRLLLSRAGNLWVRTILGLRAADTTAGFRAYRREALLTIGALTSTSDGYCFQIENTWRAERAGLRVAEVPIRFVDRAAGTSKMSARIAGEAITRSVRWRLGEGLRRPSSTAEAAAPPLRRAA